MVIVFEGCNKLMTPTIRALGVVFGYLLLSRCSLFGLIICLFGLCVLYFALVVCFGVCFSLWALIVGYWYGSLSVVRLAAWFCFDLGILFGVYCCVRFGLVTLFVFYWLF